MKKFAISVVFEYHDFKNKLRIITNDFYLVNCNNESEAIGGAYLKIREDYQYYRIIEINPIEITKQDIIDIENNTSR